MARKNRKNTVKISRHFKKEKNKRFEASQQTLTTICEGFVSDLMACNFDFNSEELLASFDKHNTAWKNYSRKVINSNLNHYDTPEKRVKLISTFEVFVDNMKNKPLKEVAPQKEDSIPEGMVKCNCETQCSTCTGYQPEEPDTSGEPEQARDFLWDSAPLENIIRALKDAGVKTTAKTITGLKRVVNNLDDIQKEYFLAEISKK